MTIFFLLFPCLSSPFSSGHSSSLPFLLSLGSFFFQKKNSRTFDCLRFLPLLTFLISSFLSLPLNKVTSLSFLLLSLLRFAFPSLIFSFIFNLSSFLFPRYNLRPIFSPFPPLSPSSRPSPHFSLQTLFHFSSSP